MITDIIHTPLFRGLTRRKVGYIFLCLHALPLYLNQQFRLRLDLIPMLSLDMSPVMALLNT